MHPAWQSHARAHWPARQYYVVSEYIPAGLWSLERRVAAQAGRALLTMLADPHISGDHEESPGQPAARTVAYEHHTRVKLRVTRLTRLK